MRVKLHLITFLTLFCISVLVPRIGFAQKFSYGMKGGLNVGLAFAKNIDLDKSSASPLFRPTVSAFFSYKANEKISISGELRYLQTGVRYKTYVEHTDTLWPISQGASTFYIQTFVAGDVSGTFDLRYLEIPVQASFKLTTNSGLIAGAKFAYLLKGKNTGTAVVDVGSDAGYSNLYSTYEDYVAGLFLHQSEQKFDESYAINKYDIGLQLGGFRQFTNRLRLEIIANYGLLSVQKPNNVMKDKLHNLYLTASIAYTLGYW